MCSLYNECLEQRRVSNLRKQSDVVIMKKVENKDCTDFPAKHIGKTTEKIAVQSAAVAQATTPTPASQAIRLQKIQIDRRCSKASPARSAREQRVTSSVSED